MKNTSSAILCFLLIFIGTQAYTQNTFKKAAGGIRYKVLSTKGGQKIESTNIVTFNFIEKTEKDSVIYSSFADKNPVKVQIGPSADILDLMDVFVNLREEDSVLVQIPTDSIYKRREEERPKFLPKGSLLYFSIKIENVQTYEEAIAEETKAIANEKELLKKYLAEHNLRPLVTASGLLFVSTKTTQQARPNPGDTVYINYIASTVDGKVFDSNLEAEERKAGIEHTGRAYEPVGFIVGENNIITAWDEGILMMTEGSWAKFIIPSELAFGGRGFGRLIKPYTTFIIDVQLFKVKKKMSYQKPTANNQKLNMGASPYGPGKRIKNNLAAFLVLLGSENRVSGKKELPGFTPATRPWFNFLNRFLFN